MNNFVCTKKERKKEEQNYGAKKLVSFVHRTKDIRQSVFAADSINGCVSTSHCDLHFYRGIVWPVRLCDVQWALVASENSRALRFVRLRDMDNWQLAQKRA